jgi:hypothetical protein
MILGLLAFMGFFLMQSSSAEYSQAALSCYATSAMQLAEAATDEAFFHLEEELAGAKKAELLKQCEHSTLPYEPNDTAGHVPSLTGQFPDLAPYVTQANGLTLTHYRRQGLKVESILVNLDSVRPIDHSWFALEDCVYRPKDRLQSFNTKMSRDFQLGLTLTTTVSLRVGTKKRKFVMQSSRDVKVVNVGPIGRNYSLYSCIGIDLRVQDDVYNDLSRGNGRLVLWNIPFQSRVYVHGPAVIGVENPDRYETDNDDGAFIVNNPDVYPGVNHAFQYDVTYAGLSYLPYPGRALWKKNSMFGGPTMEDLAEMTADEQAMYKHNTYKFKGYIPKLNSSWSELSAWVNFGKEYIRGHAKKQVFLPAGPFCRLPWRFVGEKPPNWNNQINDGFPRPSNEMKLEHRFMRDDDSVNDNTRIYSDLRRFRLYQLGTLVASQKFSGYPQPVMPEFSLSYGNPRDSEGILDSIWILTENVFKTFWDAVSAAPRMLYIGGESLVRLIIKPKDPTVNQEVDFNKVKNFFPNNFKSFPKAAVRKFRDVSEIPVDKDGVWLLDGLYWLDFFQTPGDVVYKGKGVIFVGDWVPNRQGTIRGNILRYRDPANPTSPGENHLTLVYYPMPGTGTLPEDPAYLNQCQLVIEGKGKIIEASVFSFAGIRSEGGTLTDQEYLSMGMNPNLPTKKWQVDFNLLQSKVNSICGNYVNFFMKKHRLNGDLWVFHETNNPFYYNSQTNQLKAVYGEADEVMAHTVHFSPKPQHMAYSGGGFGEE